jgi:APA family basic amino acid/polyamine antiporter
MEKLQRRISIYGLTMIAAGSCIGSGIFRSPSETASYLPYDNWMLMAWVIGGIISITGALSVAELGAMFPEAGGIYVYLRKIYGDAAAFLYGWASLTVIVSGALAAITLVFTGYINSFLHLGETGKIIFSLSVIIILCFLNVLGVKLGNIFASIITTAKLAGIFAVILIGIFLGREKIDLDFNLADFFSPSHPSMNFFSAFGMACIGVFFSYGGFHHASYLAGEVKNPQKTLPLAMIYGVLIVMFVYISINYAYLKLLPVNDIAASEKVAATSVSIVLKQGSIFIALLISVSALGTMHIYSMSAPRIYYALAEDGLFFKKLAEIHPKFHTPAVAIITQSAIACVILLFWNTFEDVINYIVFVDYIFMALAIYGVILLRKRMPDAQRPYKTWGYPVIPLIFVCFTIFVLTVSFMEKPLSALLCLSFLLAGYIVYFLFKKNKMANIKTA